MADIELVIKISEETYEYWKEHKYEYVLAEAIAKGTPLPKGHGRLIEDTFTTVTDIREDGSEFTYVPYGEIENAPTIIEADKGE